MSSTKKSSGTKSAAAKKAASRAPTAHPSWIDMIKASVTSDPCLTYAVASQA